MKIFNSVLARRAAAGTTFFTILLAIQFDLPISAQQPAPSTAPAQASHQRRDGSTSASS